MPLELDISVEWLIYAQFFIHPNNQFMCAIENSHDNEQKVEKIKITEMWLNRWEKTFR